MTAPVNAPPVVKQPVQPTHEELVLAELQKQTALLQVMANFLNNGVKT